ncbi:MAG TPA: flagellar protein FlgN [Candidatus Deferrimicrobium sp.]|nr:flagellar protein FlgN [Candidatus Deferrimicrobium sp.]
MVDRLIDILTREATLFESFLELLEQQRQALVANDVDHLNRITELQREKLIESRLLDRRREEAIAQIRAAGAVDTDLTITRLLEMVEGDQAQELSRLRDLILSLSDSINHTRDQNAMLLNRSREYIARTMSLLSRISSPGSVYGSGGAEQSHVSAVAVDRRA